MALYTELAVCSRFREQSGIPSHLFNVIIKSVVVQPHHGFGGLGFQKDVTNPAANELATRINEDVVTEWLYADDNVTTIHYYTDSESFHMVVSPEKNGSEEESSDENKKGVRERIYIDKLIKSCSHFLLQYIQDIQSQGTKQQ